MTRYFALWGAEGDDEGDDSNDSDDGSQEPVTRTLTEEEINKMVTRAADRGSRKAAKSLAQELGFDSPTEAKAWYADKQATDDANKTAEAKILEDAQKATTEAEAAKLQTRNDRLALRIDREVLRFGVVDEKLASRVATLVRADLDSDIDEDDWADSISTLLGEMKEETPALFGKAASHGSGDGGTTGDTNTSTDQEKQEKQYEKEWRDKGFVALPTA